MNRIIELENAVATRYHELIVLTVSAPNAVAAVRASMQLSHAAMELALALTDDALKRPIDDDDAAAEMRRHAEMEEASERMRLEKAEHTAERWQANRAHSPYQSPTPDEIAAALDADTVGMK